MAPVDPHSYTDGAHPVTKHAALSFYLDFAASTIHASALLTLSAPHSGDLLLDTRAVAVHSASTTSDPPEPIHFSLAASSDLVLGSALTLTLPPDTTSFRLIFSTSPAASALQWLTPPQTASGQPFIFSQCQSIHARSIFPCHDTPAARVTFSLLLNLPAQLSAVAAARHVGRRDPLPADHHGACDEALWCAPGRIIEEFEMEQPVPPYLFAFAAGGIGSRDLGPRTRVYAKGGDKVLDDAASEFAGVEEMIKVGEALFGPYEWERFDLLVLPPSFPYGGMENPRMVFLTPTVIKGDAAGAQVVAHELAHSWTGNLITNKTNEDFWLNEVKSQFCHCRPLQSIVLPQKPMS
jgi:leukotriene-A4 hydrolase